MNNGYRILLPTDYSGAADKALEVGIELAETSGSALDILHISELTPHWVTLAEKSDRNLYYGINKELDRVRGEMADRMDIAKQADIDVSDHIEFKTGYKAILNFAKEHKNNLIVMGAHGITGLLGLAMGSFTRKILHTTDLPVLVVKKDDPPFKPKRIAYLSDFDPHYVGNLPKLFDFASKMGCEVHLISVNTPATFRESTLMLERIDHYAAQAPDRLITRKVIHNAFRLEEGLTDYCERNDIDIISLQIYKKQHAWRVLGGTINDLVNHLHMPILAIPDS